METSATDGTDTSSPFNTMEMSIANRHLLYRLCNESNRPNTAYEPREMPSDFLSCVLFSTLPKSTETEKYNTICRRHASCSIRITIWYICETVILGVNGRTLNWQGHVRQDVDVVTWEKRCSNVGEKKVRFSIKTLILIRTHISWHTLQIRILQILRLYIA